MSGTLLALLSR